MRKDDDEDWEAEAQAVFSGAAESEFSRYKHALKVKAGLIRKPWYLRAYDQFKRLLSRILRRR